MRMKMIVLMRIQIMNYSCIIKLSYSYYRTMLGLKRKTKYYVCNLF
jgi:hypothetical protein